MHDLSSLFAVCTILPTVDVKGNTGVIELSCSPGWSLYFSFCIMMQLRIYLLSPRCDASPLYPFIHLAHVVQRMDNAIHWIKQFGFPNTYPLNSRAEKNLNSSLSFGQAALTFCLPGATTCLS